MAVIAKYCPNIEIKVVDINQERIDAWNNSNLNKLPIFEPGLSEIINNVREKNLEFTTNLVDSIKEADMVFISVNTPIKQNGIGAGQTSDLRWVEACARQISEIAIGHTIVVEKSTLPVRTAKTIKEILFATNDNNQQNKSFSVLSNPEFLAEGTAINDLENPDRVLIGGEDKEAMLSLKQVYLNWVKEDKIIFTNLWSSELSKLCANAFLAQRISSINSISALCEVTGANIGEVANAVGQDSRIGNKFLKTGPGFGGSCFKKDILNLVYLSRFYGLDEVADYWEKIIEINSWQKMRIYEQIVKNLFGNLVDKKIGILGFAFKANTNDTRESPAIDICKNLINEGAFLSIHDYKVSKENISTILSKENNKNWEYVFDVYEVFNSSDAVVILTEWEGYKNLNWNEIALKTKRPFWIFDTRAILRPEELKKINLNLWQIGNGYQIN